MKDVSNRKHWFEDVKGNILENVDEKISLPFENGYGNKSFKQMLAPIAGQKGLTGNSYWLVSEVSAYGLLNKTAEAFIPIRPDRVRPVTSRSGMFLIRYEIDPEGIGNWQPLEVDEVIHFSQDEIFNPFVGVGNVEKARLMFEAELRKDKYAISFLKKGAVPSMLVTDQTERLPKDINMIADKLNSKFGGEENAGKIMYLSGKKVDGKQLQMSNKDMEFLDERKFNRQTILSLFGVPPSVVGIDVANRSIAETQRLNYLDNTINPILEELESAINQQFVHKIDKRVFLRLEKHTTGDVENVIKKLQAGIITPNMASEATGEQITENDPLRDAYYMPMNIQPIGAEVVVEEGKGSSSCDTKTANKDLSDPHNYDAICDSLKSATRTKKFQIPYLRAGLKSRAKTEDSYVSAIAKFFGSQTARVLKNLKDNEIKINALLDASKKSITDDVVSLLFDLKAENAEMVQEIRPLHTSALQKAIGNVNKITGATVTESLSNPAVVNTIDILGKNIVGSMNSQGKFIAVNETTQAILAKLVVDAVKQDEGIIYLQESINRKLGGEAQNKARRIARTESRIAYDAGNKIVYEDLGVKTVDVVGCTQFEPDSDCGKQDIPILNMSSLVFHPNHIGVVVPSEEI